MRLSQLFIRCTLALCLLPFTGAAAIISFSAPMTPGQEVPAPDLSGGFTPSGNGTAVVDTDTLTLVGSMSWTGLTTGAFMGHIHRRPVGSPTGPVLIGYFMVDVNSPLGQTGSVNPTINISQAQLTSLLEGLAEGTIYFNLHTVRNRPGEIRGDVTDFTAIPEPATWGLLGVGLAGLAAARARRR